MLVANYEQRITTFNERGKTCFNSFDSIFQNEAYFKKSQSFFYMKNNANDLNSVGTLNKNFDHDFYY